MTDTTVLERWAEDGVPTAWFDSPYLIRRDIQDILRIVQEHVDIKIEEALRE